MIEYMKNKKFRVGDIIMSKNNNYTFTCKSNRWIGIVTCVNKEKISAKTIYCKYLLEDFIDTEFLFLNPDEFIRIYNNKEFDDENYMFM